MGNTKAIISHKGGKDMPNQDICCNVTNCRYNDSKNHCGKGTITVGCSVSAPHHKCDTECGSFEERC